MSLYVVPQLLGRGITLYVGPSFSDSRQPFTTMGTPPRSVAPRHTVAARQNPISWSQDGNALARMQPQRSRRCPGTLVGHPQDHHAPLYTDITAASSVHFHCVP
ncbi:hypothetical protein KM043_015385 [Ampulex compressa]|nr:hypothetical protein KM043_015385 [Ampulex compressa]